MAPYIHSVKALRIPEGDCGKFECRDCFYPHIRSLETLLNLESMLKGALMSTTCAQSAALVLNRRLLFVNWVESTQSVDCPRNCYQLLTFGCST
jgi:hypothetical protein